MTLVYTAIYGRSDGLQELPVGVRGICFTDDADLDIEQIAFRPEGPHWEIRYEPLHHLGHPRLKAKLWKVRPDLADLDTDTALWVDGSMQLLPGGFEAMEAELGERDALFFRHHARDCIYDEVPASFGGRPLAYENQSLYEQAERYRFMGYPPHYGLFASGCMLRRDTPAVRAFNARWWDEICRWSTQDQLSMSIATWMNELDWTYFSKTMIEQEWFFLHQHVKEN